MSKPKRMDLKIKDKWVKALRSGRYKQGHGKLYLPWENSYCCLGVLCKVLRKPIEEGATDISDDISTELAKELGLSRRVKNYIDVESRLVALNDEEGKDFYEIADWIEKNV